MKICRLASRGFASVGIQIAQSTSTEKCMFNRRHVQMLFIQCSAFGFCCLHLFFIANKLDEYAFCVYDCTTFLLVIIIYTICVWKAQEISRLLNSLEETIDKSMKSLFIHISYIFSYLNRILGSKYPGSTANYAKVNLLGEKWSKFVEFSFVKLALNISTFPKFIYCLYQYYAMDLGTDAFELPFPIW